MNRNVRIAKELVKLAKSLVSFEDEKTAAWSWKHPFTFNKTKQSMNELEEKIENGEITDVILIRIKIKYKEVYEREDGEWHSNWAMPPTVNWVVNMPVLDGTIIVPQKAEIPQPNELEGLWTKTSEYDTFLHYNYHQSGYNLGDDGRTWCWNGGEHKSGEAKTRKFLGYYDFSDKKKELCDSWNNYKIIWDYDRNSIGYGGRRRCEKGERPYPVSLLD